MAPRREVYPPQALHIEKPPLIGCLIRIPSSKKRIEPILAVIVPGELVVEEVVIPNEPHKSFIVAHHSPHIQQHKNKRKLGP